ncbi:MAG: hypothetical protein K9G76_01095 [Bacteroidales bacterium]|nr:hypothetical protein [Bacteroidales bacterium]MCF8402711.1 hypothetical protein [Bacteroidales bacterium]
MDDLIKKSLNKLFFTNILLILLPLFSIPLYTKRIELNPEDTNSRLSITFILGQDSDKKNPFYSTAESYFRSNKKEKTEIVITHFSSLAEVQEYLIQHAPANNLPWGLVNLVSHGNQCQGLRVKITANGSRASAQNIRKGIAEGLLNEMPKHVLDENSLVVLHACGLGKDTELTEAVKMAFSGKFFKPIVQSSPYFEYYVTSKNKESEIARFEADYWYIYYKMGYRPEDRVIEQQLKNKYKGESLDWHTALQKTAAYKAGDVFHYTYDVPVKWVIRYPHVDSVPTPKSQRECEDWVRKNPQIMTDLKDINIPPGKFNWWFRKIYVKNDDGSKSPALWVKGYCTFFCVLKLRPPA